MHGRAAVSLSFVIKGGGDSSAPRQPASVGMTDMATNGLRPHKNQGARDALESLDRPQTLGTDAAGAVHHHSAYDDRVVVVDADGAIERTFDLSDRKLATYVAFVAEGRGWSRLHYAESFGEILREAIDP